VNLASFSKSTVLIVNVPILFELKAQRIANGYDVLSAPVLNTTLSTATCTTIVGAQQTVSPGIGGTDVTLYRLLTITQSRNTTCVYDFYARLALGSHLFPGSSLHANLALPNGNGGITTSGIGASDVSIPVKEIAPQELRKTMNATQDTDHTWNVTKGATPVRLDFSNTCDPNASRQAAVQITVTWQKITVNGDIAVVTNIYAKNPASRTITVNVTDVIYSGTTLLDTANAGPTDIPANTEQLVLTHTLSIADGTTNLNDIATATYTDRVTGVTIPGNTTATASATVQPSGINKNNTAVINDVESITGAGLSYSVDNVSGASGSFDSGYVTGTVTSGSVGWTSTSQSGNGSVTFNKTIYVSAGTSTSGTLSDTATLTASDGFTTNDTANVSINANARVSLTINKNIPNVLGSGESASFNFEVRDRGNNLVSTKTLSFGPGDTFKSVTITGLAPDNYTVHEIADLNGKWNTQSDQVAHLTLPTCSGSVTFNNTFNSASAQVRKVTIPAGNEAGWEFTLTGPGTPSGGEKVTTNGTNYVSFSTALQEGNYIITETPKTGFDQTSASSQCSFTVNYPTDANRTFSCTYTNTQRGTIIVKKVTNPSGASGSFTFTGNAAGSISDGGSIPVSNLVPGTYTSTEADPTPNFDLTSISCDDRSSATPSSGNLQTRTATFKLDPGETVTCIFTNTQRGKVKVVKTVSGAAPSGTQAFTFQLCQSATLSSVGTILETQVANAANGGVLNFTTSLTPGATYQLCEIVMPGWLTSLQNAFVPNGNDPLVDNSVMCVNFTVQPGETKTFNVDNTPPPGGRALTIGFWKNWASCANSNSKQKPVLDQTLAKAEPNGIKIGTLTLHGSSITPDKALDCSKAVSLLNKTTIDGKKKMASDPAFNMAAQLLAAKLNIVDGAGTSPSVLQAITDADALLTAIHFDGLKHDNMTASQIALANKLAKVLDDYNNDRPVTYP
jgi:nicotinamide mononucleotide (NMN) deamidase PncC